MGGPTAKATCPHRVIERTRNNNGGKHLRIDRIAPNEVIQLRLAPVSSRVELTDNPAALPERQAPGPPGAGAEIRCPVSLPIPPAAPSKKPLHNIIQMSAIVPGGLHCRRCSIYKMLARNNKCHR